jgi:ribosomal protein L34E
MKLNYGGSTGWLESEHERWSRPRFIWAAYVLGRRFPGGRVARLRALWHVVVRRYDAEICDDCGRPVGRGIRSWWHAPDDLWMHINGGYAGVLCPACFTERCDAQGIWIHWVATVEQIDALGEKGARDA